MPPSRACQQCRSAKARCDLATPVCGRCTARGSACSGAAQQGNLLFLDETAVAQRNSWLARRPRQRGLGQPSASTSTAQSSSSPSQPIELSDGDMRSLYYWLSDANVAGLAAPLRKDVETRAVERFFFDWTLNPSNDGLSPGYLNELPGLYAATEPGSILWNAVRALAFGDLKGYHGGSFAVKARQSYGAALTQMRLIANDSSKLAQDRVLAALLLIDKFELIFLSRREPLGPHKNALQHILSLRGEGQFQDRTQFELWRAAQQRLQAQRIAQRDDTSNEQLAWLAKLNSSLPDLHVCVDVERMVVLCSAAKKFLQVASGGQEELQHATELLKTMGEVIESMERWAADVDAAWKARRINARPSEEEGECRPAQPEFTRSPTLQYGDPWLAYKWNFHSASQIVLRQSMVEMREYLSRIFPQHQQQQRSEQERQQAQELVQGEITAASNATAGLAAKIIDSCIPLLGFSMHGESHPQGKMARRFFAICAMWVVQQARFSTNEQKATSTAVLAWIDRTHRLDS